MNGYHVSYVLMAIGGILLLIGIFSAGLQGFNATTSINTDGTISVVSMPWQYWVSGFGIVLTTIGFTVGFGCGLWSLGHPSNSTSCNQSGDSK